MLELVPLAVACDPIDEAEARAMIVALRLRSLPRAGSPRSQEGGPRLCEAAGSG